MLLGAGAEADVFSSDGLTALKRFRKTPANWNAAVHAEITYAMEALKHPNLVRVLELDVSAGCLRMEYMDGGSLADVLLSNGALHDKHILQIEQRTNIKKSLIKITIVFNRIQTHIILLKKPVIVI